MERYPSVGALVGRSAKIFFAAAFIVAIGWGVLETLLYLGRRPAPDCEVVGEIDRPGDVLLSTVTDGFWIYSSADERISLVRTGAGDSRLDGLSTLKSTPLRCDKPAYTCFMPAQKGGPAKLSPFFVQDDLALVTDDQGTVHPVALGEAPRRAAPVKICGHAPNPATARFFAWSGRLGVFEPETGRLGIWALSKFEGAAKGDPGREPDELWKVSFPGGLARLSCDEKTPPLVADMAMAANRLFLLVSPPNAGPTLLAFATEPGIYPDPDWKNQFEGVSRMWAAGPRKLVIASSANDRLQMLTFADDLKTAATEKLLSKNPNAPLVRVAEASDRELVVFSRRVFGRASAELSSARDIAVLPLEDFAFRRASLGAQGWLDRGDGRGVWARQNGDSLRLTSVKCRFRSERKEDQAD